MISSLEVLRSAIADETLTLAERRTAAEHYISELLGAVPTPSEDDREVIALRTPPSPDGPLGDIHLRTWRIQNEMRGWRADGPTSVQARQYIRDQQKFRALLAVVVDEDAHRLEKLAACNVILHDHLDPANFYRVNGYDAEKMLSAVKSANATKWTSAGKVLIVRPPDCMADVWQP